MRLNTVFAKVVAWLVRWRFSPSLYFCPMVFILPQFYKRVFVIAATFRGISFQSGIRNQFSIFQPRCQKPQTCQLMSVWNFPGKQQKVSKVHLFLSSGPLIRTENGIADMKNISTLADFLSHDDRVWCSVSHSELMACFLLPTVLC